MIEDKSQELGMPNYTSMGRDKLIEEHKAMFANLSATQARCTQLLEENRVLKKLISRHCYNDPSIVGCCAGPKACTCECYTCCDPNA